MDKAETQVAESWDAERTALFARIRAANTDLADRVRESGVTFDYDERDDSLTITLGERATDSYTQGSEALYLDLDIESDRILAITIPDFESTFVTTDSRHMFDDLLPALRHYHTLSFSAEREGTRQVAESLRDLMPA